MRTRVSCLAVVILAWSGLVGLSCTPTVRAAESVSAAITAAVDNPARPDADKQRDVNRKPAESIAFAGLKPGDKIVDLLPGSGYFTRIFSRVVGPKGHVYAVWPQGVPETRTAAVKAIAADPAYANVTELEQPLTALKLSEPVDMVWTSQNYHDLHNIPGLDLGAVNKSIFDALKPGGIYIVLDHAATAGSGFRDTSTLHRIDPEAVKAEVQAAGFKLVAESDVLRNSADPHTAKVFDPSIRGKTDQFILKFQKPAK
ncbi:MAG TPA: methyltransferase [Alphaproteobacteria bacterium]|nr:methyltransferase [Alphaproteobacteria bacterium]